MNIRGVSLLVFTVLVLVSSLSCWGQASDDYGPQALATFESKLKSLPTDQNVKYVSFLCMRLPVRDKKPGQIGRGFPGERDTKLKCMLQFLVVMDQLIEENPAPVSMQSGSAAIEHLNFQMQLVETRRAYAVFRIPGFITYDYPASEKNQHLLDIITDGLKSDPKAADVMASLLAQVKSS